MIDETNFAPTDFELRVRAEERECVLKLLDILAEKKAIDIIAIDVADKTIIADWFITCSGSSVLQVKAICDEVCDKSDALGLTLRRKEGYNEGRWIVLDYGHILVHIFHPEEREYYNIERLWTDGSGELIRYEEKA